MCGFFGGENNNCLCWIIIIAVILWVLSNCGNGCGCTNDRGCGC